MIYNYHTSFNIQLQRLRTLSYVVMDDCHSDVSILGKSIVDSLTGSWIFLVGLLLLFLLDYHLLSLRKIEAFAQVLCVDEKSKLEGVEVIIFTLELKGLCLYGIEEEISESC